MVAAAFIPLGLEISAPGGRPVNFGLSMRFVVSASAPLGIGAHTLSTALGRLGRLLLLNRLVAPAERLTFAICARTFRDAVRESPRNLCRPPASLVWLNSPAIQLGGILLNAAQ